MRAAWKMTIYTLVALDAIATYYHSPAAWPLSVAAMVMVMLSCLATLIAEVRHGTEAE